MQKSSLIILEGICGSGKSTIAKRLYNHLISEGLPAVLIQEESINHPICLAWHAYLTKTEYHELLKNNAFESKKIIANSYIEEDYALVRYRNTKGLLYSNILSDILSEKEFCYGEKAVVDLGQFTEVTALRFKRFSESFLDTGKIIIAEAFFMQHQIHDLHRLYNAGYKQILHHTSTIALELKVLNPMLIYLNRENVKMTLEKIAYARPEEKYLSPAKVKYFENRKKIELKLLEDIPMDYRIIENTEYNWDNVFGKITGILNHRFL